MEMRSPKQEPFLAADDERLEAQNSNRGTLLGTPNWEPQEYSRYIIGIYLPLSLYSIIFLLYSWGSLFGVPSRVPLSKAAKLVRMSCHHRVLSIGAGTRNVYRPNEDLIVVQNADPDIVLGAILTTV